ncbi:response regulator [Sulfoacidibacillus thermotolerans]|uniref:Two-component system response regulator n=1 Tax=Sulfoacidibacillus thermotolerans TaxID=1765684 RepID=A0A2U3D9J6_SULT2|nr:two-component system response regulator [Sulfoacidibacillus thermotolerans]
MKILVVDDQFGIRLLLQEVLSRDGYEVYCAENGTQALSVLAREQLQLVLLDMKIPGMNGIEILTNIRKLDPRLKVIMMTAYGELDLVKEAAALNAIGHFAKPFDIDEMRRYIAQLIGVPGNDGNVQSAGVQFY